ncbi:unnamed protein product [Brassica rapa]|uniref:BnaAnng09270D protein n=8 Tax=Brassica TaxID=3705 RepID=A0A078EU67_BRANA|nr:LTP [Brassica rapa subsp. oleifera]ABU80736.1 putative LTP-like protein [Brassica juncea var. multiceps]ABU80737.1 putative LTP-like protein [Brassica rapa subsp. pekinensis]ABU80738.1 putative LTP-like protein [Brassica rapa subsp. rapa]ABU80741.1 putative LTP-like protein [Brassica rapa subsp. chinensis]ABU80746.1 putative LTP-like protein [Brassica rapa subsp. narinosa]CAG7890457.1 unnamed protein product [Brassica rapa]CDY47895.1 BnaAnng09270D [Brassica napus]
MKLISLMCIAFVILLTSFPATAITFNPACIKNHDTCGPLVAVKGRRWRPECCKIWSGNVLPETRQCACYVLKHSLFGNGVLPLILAKCKLGGIEQFKCSEVET